MEEVLSSSFAPSHGVFTALWLSLSTWFPGQAPLPCLRPHHPSCRAETLWQQRAALPDPSRRRLLPPSRGWAVTGPYSPWFSSESTAHKLSTHACGVYGGVPGGGDPWAPPQSKAAPEGSNGAEGPLLAGATVPHWAQGGRGG